MDYLLQFVIGSCVIVFLPFFIFVHQKIKNKKLNINYFYYTLYMPFLYGIINVFGKFLQNIFDLTDISRYFIVAVSTYLTLIFILFYFNLYNYKRNECFKHIFGLFFWYLFIWLVIINLIEKLILDKKINNYEKNIIVLIIILYLLNHIFQYLLN